MESEAHTKLDYAGPDLSRPFRRRRALNWATFLTAASMLTVPVLAMAAGKRDARFLAIGFLLVASAIYIGLRVAAGPLSKSWLAVALAVPAFVTFLIFWGWLSRQIMPWDWEFNTHGRLIACCFVVVGSATPLIWHFRRNFGDPAPLP